MLELIVSGKIGGTQYRDYSLLDFHRDIDDVFGTSGMNRRGRYGGLGLLEDSGVTRRLVAHIRRTARPAKPENVQVVDVFMVSRLKRQCGGLKLLESSLMPVILRGRRRKQ